MKWREATVEENLLRRVLCVWCPAGAEKNLKLSERISWETPRCAGIVSGRNKRRFPVNLLEAWERETVDLVYSPVATVSITTMRKHTRPSINSFFWHFTSHKMWINLLGVYVMLVVSRDSAVGIATGYGLEDWEVVVQVPVGSRIITSPCRPDRLWGPPNLPYNGYRELFPGGKAAGAWSWPLTSN
jgi:hypothetical protein